MNDSNPYQSPATKPRPRGWFLVDFILAGLWIAIPIGVFAGRQILLPIYLEFGIELPAVTQLLVRLYAPVPLSYLSILVLAGILLIPHGNVRRVFLAFACVLGLFVGLLCLLAHATAMVRLIEGLDG
ncbi:hypothetical protein NG895_00655 [Aeoliella sp. ICT_H6.2]|uniref:Uncharacterized protein n=1 Tax=Aeoliella straminimaris TaxID=2954799 RepID=A0A9X2F582_9BACT|nr:hypothetical protein [Aeoliella straminimaris]MCO6042405.1 hypothetical protein [Aeoliella straminimaris]